MCISKSFSRDSERVAQSRAMKFTDDTNDQSCGVPLHLFQLWCSKCLSLFISKGALVLLWKGTVKGKSSSLQDSVWFSSKYCSLSAFYIVQLSAHAQLSQGLSNTTWILARTLPGSYINFLPQMMQPRLTEVEKLTKSPLLWERWRQILNSQLSDS